MSDIYSDTYNEEPIAEINIIPFVDIILVVLIIFMITAPQLIREGFSVTLPKAISGAEEISPSVKFKIEVTNTGDILLDGNLMSLNNLSLYARKLLETGSVESRLIISADVSVSHGRVMEIIDVMKRSGIQQFTFAVQP
ncbi:MAG: biopolymer transporter ExbD [Bdellovibrionales bacterium]|nr:biopolymer transporter ExbD [Bdellovibrionales bacterium]